MYDLIESIPGPIFLLIFLFYSIIVIIMMRRFATGDTTSSNSVIEPTTLSPLELSILENGTTGAVITSVFSLWNKGLVEIKSSDKKVQLIPKDGASSGLKALEESIYNRVSGVETVLKDLTTGSFSENADRIIKPERERMRQLGLLPDSAALKRHSKASAGAVFLLLIFGGIKLLMGFYNYKPLTFLTVLMIAAIIAAIVIIGKNKNSPTVSGKKMLARSRTRFSHLMKEDAGKSVLSNKDILYGAAIFGISSLAGGAIIGELGDAALLDKAAKSSYGSGCAGCSGCSGDGGSGDGCGGGCGGCGGD